MMEDASLNSGSPLAPHTILKCLQINLRHSKTAAATIAQLFCENHLDVILVQEPYALSSNKPVIADIPPGYLSFHTLNESHAYGAAVLVKLSLASSMRTKALVASNHIAGVDIGPFRFISAYFRAYTENVTFFF